MEYIENRMVVDSEWPEHRDVLEEEKEKLNGPGWEEVGTGIFVPEEDAFKYALERISQDEGEKKEFIEWFYSNWIREG